MLNLSAMKVYQLYATQFLPTGPDTAWEFLSDPRNLQHITPGHMNFSMLTDTVSAMYPGQVICYKVTLWPGISVKWVTEITHVEYGSYFVDEQRFGPYSFWHHKHFINKADGGVIMQDIVDYKLPMGILGQWMNHLVIKNKLSDIFSYRAEKLEAYFGEGKESAVNIKFRSF